MRKILSLVLAVLMVFTVIIPAFAVSESDLVIYDKETGKSLPIIISEDAPETDRTAASKLQYYLKQCTGADFEISADGEKGIFVGQAGASGMDMSEIRDEGYRIKVSDGSLLIAGAGKRGTIYGVFAFLQDYCGCRWYTSKLIVTPQSDRLCIAGDTDKSFNHVFEYRETDWISPRDREYSLANQLNSNIYRTFDEASGGNVRYVGLGGFAHTLTTAYCSGSKYFDQEPELFALHGGKRTPNQLCLTNEKTYQIVHDEVLGYLENNCDKNDKNLQILSLTQNDNYDYCECENCKALDDKYGSHSGSLLTFINRIAKDVEDAGYSNIAIDTFAYQYTRKPPKGIAPRDNVIVRLCSIECCFCHPLDDPECSQNVDFMNDLRDWGKICSRVYIWDYANNYANTNIAFSDFGVLQKNMQIFVENKVRGVYEEGAYYADTSNGEFAELRAYLLSRLLVDPYMDYEKEMNGFLSAYYGEAGPFIREYIDILEKSESENDHMSIYDKVEDMYKSLKRRDIRHIDELWTSAENAVGTDFQKANVRRSEISWLMWKAYTKVSEFSRLQLPSVWMSANENLYNRLLEENVILFSEGSDYIIRDPELRNFIVATNPYFWKTSKLGNEKAVKEHTRKYDFYVSAEEHLGFILEPVLKLLNTVFSK